jgi:hypothetical protein
VGEAGKLLRNLFFQSPSEANIHVMLETSELLVGLKIFHHTRKIDTSWTALLIIQLHSYMCYI